MAINCIIVCLIDINYFMICVRCVGMCTLCLWFIHMVYLAWQSLQRTFYPQKGGAETTGGKGKGVERWREFLGHGVYATGSCSSSSFVAC